MAKMKNIKNNWPRNEKYLGAKKNEKYLDGENERINVKKYR